MINGRTLMAAALAALICSGLATPGTARAQIGPDRPKQGTPLIVSLYLRPWSCGPVISFDLDADGDLDQVQWPASSSAYAWLALDRNGDGQISDGSELFGDAAEQEEVEGVDPNGFEALKVFDRADRGGNEDGLITSADEVWTSLRAWHDEDTDGEVDKLFDGSSELLTLGQAGVLSISLGYESLDKQTCTGRLYVGYAAPMTRRPYRGITQSTIADVLILVEED